MLLVIRIESPFDLLAFNLKSLRDLLKDPSVEAQYKHKNIEFLVHYYKNGGKPPRGQITWLLDGKIVDKEPEPEEFTVGWRYGLKLFVFRNLFLYIYLLLT